MNYYRKALQINRDVGNRHWEAYNYDNIAWVYATQSKHSEALNYFLKAISMLKDMDDKVAVADCYIGIGDIYIRTKKYEDANMYLNDALLLAKETGALNYVRNGYEKMTVLDSATGNWKGAFENLKLFVAYRDSLSNEENSKKTVQVAMQYEFDKKEALTKAEQEKKDAFSASETQKQRTIKYAITGGLVIMLLFAFGLYKRFNEKRKANAVLEKTLQDLKETQAQLIRSEKMAAFGTMAQRVSHEIQNPLNFVNNFSDISEDLAKEILITTNENEKTEITNQLLSILTKINMHGKRASAIVKQLQQHSLAGTAHEFFEENENV